MGSTRASCDDMERSVFSIFCIWSVGCIHTYRDFKPTDRNYDEGVAIGQVHIHLNGKPMNEHCNVTIAKSDASRATASQTKLTSEGYVFVPVHTGKAALLMMSCNAGSYFKLEGAEFEMATTGVTYIGDMTVNWTAEDSDTPLGFVGASQAVERKDGQMTMTVGRSNKDEVIAEYVKITGAPPRTLAESIISVGH
jgi:hypothetical protein